MPSSPEPLPENGHALLGKLLGFDTYTVEDRPSIEKDTAQNNNDKDAAAEEQEQEFEFRLFSTTTQAKKRVQDDGQNPDAVDKDRGTHKLRIRIRSPTPGPVDPNEGRFVNPFRGWQYYFTSPALMSGQHAEADPTATMAAKRREYEDVAVSGRQLLEWAGKGTWVSLI